MNDSFYDQNAGDFFSSTVHIDAAPLYEKFLPLIPDGGSILDAGCGSGRDAKAFSLKGYDVTAFDSSPALSALAQVMTGITVQVCRFDEFQSDKTFDGIWACASLLHIPLAELKDIFSHLAQYLAYNGHFYCSFKYGEGETTRDTRHFTNMTEISLAEILQGTSLHIHTSWETSDLRPGREHEKWLNAILHKA